MKSAAPEVTAASVDPQASPTSVTPTAVLPMELRRSDVKAVQKLGPGAIFANVELDPVMRNDRFFGWKIMRMRSAGWKQNELRAGDIVQRVNGQTIERPEEAVQVFKSLEGAKQIVIDFERAGRPMSQSSTIVD